MDPITQQTTIASAGGKKGPPYVDDVFSTFLYRGGSAQTITNGIDLAGEGGMVWLKAAEDVYSNKFHALYDTERGTQKYISTNEDNAEQTNSSGEGLTSFNNNGFTIGTGPNFVGGNWNGDFASWTFRKSPGFFDVVTYTGNGSNPRQIPHSLGSVPGMIIVKCTSETGSYGWYTYHVSTGGGSHFYLHRTDAETTNSSVWGANDGVSGVPTSTYFTVSHVNDSNKTYVAYVFANNDAQFGTDENESIIKCGSYTGNNSTNGPIVNCGWPAAWLLVKRVDSSGEWLLWDNMRGGDLENSRPVYPDKTGGGSYSSSNRISFTTNGFQIKTTRYDINAPSNEYIYMAIRRPNKPIDDATDLFEAIQVTSPSSGAQNISTNIQADLIFKLPTTSSDDRYVWDRGRDPGRTLDTSGISTERVSAADEQLVMGNDHLYFYAGWAYGAHHYNMFRRNPGFLDIVTYQGGQTQPHNLGVVPELMIVKSTDLNNAQWIVYHASLGNTGSLRLNDDSAFQTNSWSFNNTTPTATNFYLGNDSMMQHSSYNYVAYLFASKPGVCKIGSYTGTGSAFNIDCGFTNGARFILTKRTNEANYDWYVWSSLMGINSGGDWEQKFSGSTDSGAVTSQDAVDPYSAGFGVGTSNITNQSGKTFIYMAIA